SELDPAERARLLTFEDPAWCLLTANMAARLDRRAYAGQNVRFEVQPPPPAKGGSGRATFQATTVEAELAMTSLASVIDHRHRTLSS
ncbi:unnamed protein product, partial [Sphacelaria rigidula]